MLTVVMWFDDSIFIEVAESKQSGLFDGGSQQLIKVRIGHWHTESLQTSLHASCRTYFRQL